jgi:general secretion pathway protein E
MDTLPLLSVGPSALSGLWGDLLWGAGYPRGPGIYFHPVKLIILTAAFFGWVKTVAWVDRDAIRFDVPRELYNVFLVISGALGLALAVMIPLFGIGMIVLLALWAAPALAYVHVRNQQAPASQQVLTPDHFRRILAEFGVKQDKDDEEELPEVRFITKGGPGGGIPMDDARVARAMKSRGYQSAIRVIADALKKRATDIHMEPTREEMSVRYRIDSILHAVEGMDRVTGDSVLNIFKVLANLDITEKRKAQDGSFSAEVAGREVDFRVATAGSVVGEKMVMRILDSSHAMTELPRVGLRDKLVDQMREVIAQPHGLFLCCGPTGAGKSSTLYACLNEIDRFQRNVITLENPVEYQLHNVTQIEVNPKQGKTFANELRSILRQDPDVIMVGEIRDAETAEIACQAAQTGHFVLSTVHANDTVTALGRLLDLKIQPFLLANALSAVLGQRLVRLLCPDCKIKYQPTPEIIEKYRLPKNKVKFLYRPPEEKERSHDADGDVEVCETCSNTGYRGRTGIFELMVITDEIRELIRSNPNMLEVKRVAMANGLVLLYDDGMRKVLEGKTSLQELLRVAK